MVSGFPGGVGVSGLQVYDWPTADGLCGGSPHVHLACSEAYVVTGGKGGVQTLTSQGFAETPLGPGDVAWFTPGTIHRLINDGDLRIVVIMQNSGLPEAGDAVFTFPAATLAAPEAYHRAADISGGPDGGPAGGWDEAARRRRDLAIEGFLELRRRTDEGDTGALEDFYRSAVRLKADRFAAWEERWRKGALTAAMDTAADLIALKRGGWSHLTQAEVHHRTAPDEADRRLGMCGRLDTYDPYGSP